MATAVRKSRLRMHRGTLASWLAMLGAGIVESITTSRMQSGGTDKDGTSKSTAIFNANDNESTITDSVRATLLVYGLEINVDTLYRSHSM